jgi:hypothetical protein
MQTVIVYHNRTALMLDKQVADDLGHWPGRELTEAETWEAIEANAAAGIAACKQAIAAKNQAK